MQKPNRKLLMNTIIFKKIKKFLQMKRHQDFDHNDVFLVEFPKSGITWLSFLIANSLLKNHDENVTFYNYHKYIADIHQLRGRLPPNFKPLTDKNKVVSASLCCVV
jgi:hypothetical protein